MPVGDSISKASTVTPAATATSHRFNLRILVSPANADVAVARLKAAFGEGAELERRHAAEHATAGRLASSKFNSISEATSLHDFLWRMLTEEMEWSERVVAKDTDVVPRFRLITPDGDYHILVQMKDDELDRLARLKLVAGFMAWKMASAFIVSGENYGPRRHLQLRRRARYRRRCVPLNRARLDRRGDDRAPRDPRARPMRPLVHFDDAGANDRD